jgi:proton-translocating NADH-quinone oxidoreductase chain N
MFENEFLGLLPEIFLLTATILLLVFGVVFSSSALWPSKQSLLVYITWLAIASLIVTILLIVSQPVTTATLCYNTLIIDAFTYYCKIALLLSTSCILVMCLHYFRLERMNSFESVILILLSSCSMLFMISAYDLIAIYLAIELQSLCFYVIAASKRTSEFSTEAGLKYFLLGAFSSGILLFGCSIIYGFTGVTNCEQLAQLFTGYPFSINDSIQLLTWDTLQLASISSHSSLQSSALPSLGIVFVAVGFLFKITAVPFHMWAPDVYEGSPTYVTAFFSIAPKIAILACMVRVFFSSFYDPTWHHLFVVCSIASMLVGAVAGLAQTKIKRLLAYSSIGHVGYLLIGLACGTIEGIQALLIGIFIYVLMTLNIFAILLALRQSSSGWMRFDRYNAHSVRTISDLSALAKTNPILAITLSVTMFSFAGIPPLAGFCSKFYLFFAALGCGAYLLALVGVIASVISCFYYIRFVKVMYFDTPAVWSFYKPLDREKSVLLAVTFCLIALFFLYPSPLFLVTHQMALSLCL